MDGAGDRAARVGPAGRRRAHGRHDAQPAARPGVRELIVLPQTKERYLRSPSWLSTDPPKLALRVWEGDRETDRAFALEGDPTGVPCARDDEPDDERRAVDGAFRVVVEHRDGNSVVRLSAPFGDVTVFAARGTAAAPCVLSAEGGVWVAFHHDVREDSGEVDLAKWIALRFVDTQGRVFEPAFPMADRDRDREGEEQSFEFPSLAIGPDGALAIFGRGSHCFYRQDVSSQGWGPRVPLGDDAWGCRGRRVAARVSGGALLTARREKGGIHIESGLVPTGGRPELVPAQVTWPDRGARHAMPLPDRSRDPAMHDGRRTLFGDIHQHSAHSDGIGTADEPYLRARFVYGDDFCALTDHESFIGKRIGPGEWKALVDVANAHDAPGRFATLLAYEWTGKMFPGPGHKVVYLPAEGGAIVSRDDVPEGKALVDRVRAQGGFAVPHHVGWTGANEDAHDPIGQPVWEICSCHGCYESFAHPLGQRGDLRDQMIDAVLARGHRFGFIACSDGHGLLFHHGVGRKRDPFRTGLTAVQARACTREAILEAIRERRCYATSGAKILLDLRAGDAPMGSVLPLRGAMSVRAEAQGTGPIDRLELVGKAGVLASIGGDGHEATLTARLADDYVYARVVQEDGEMAWSSPIFFDR